METAEQIRELVNGAPKEQQRERFIQILEMKKNKETQSVKIHCSTCEVDYEYTKNNEGKWVENFLNNKG
ncbi:hypothetical protein CVD28_02495 [Bacillus sp. M6-12]|nr:hypothetical protein CVD28_02495 [Bacillus sp. M6-12]